VGAGADPLGVTDHAATPGAARRAGLHAVDEGRAAATPSPRRRCPRRPSRAGRRRRAAWSAIRRRARSRTASVSSSSRHGGAHNPCSATSSERWSATLNQRISSTVSPQNSTRSGCSSVGGKTSRMPPRTANSPRRSTRSVRVYAAAARSSTTCSRGRSSPAWSATGAQVTQTLGDRLQDRPDGGDDDGEVAVGGVPGIRVGQATQHGQALADGVTARAEPLVRQGLPAGEEADTARAQASLERGLEVFGLAAGRGDREHRGGGGSV
jgi:hypothetical protein